MATRAYAGVGGKARKVKRIYIGVNGKARNVKKVYVGVNGKARLCWRRPGLYKYGGSVPNLSVARYELSATTVGNYALFGGGGNDGNIYSSTVDAYNSSLTRTTATSLSKGRIDLAATTVGNYALFGGGCGYGINGYTSYSSTVDAYNSSLTRTTATDLDHNFCYLSSTTVGNYALFAISDPTYDSYESSVNAYNTSLTRIIATNLSKARGSISSTTVGNYALFAGGSFSYVNSNFNTVDVYNSSLTRTTATSLSIARHSMNATTVGNYALFGGGYSNGPNSQDKLIDVIDVYNGYLSRTSIGAFNNIIRDYAATTVGNYALFGGGGNSGNTKFFSTVYAYENI